MFEIKELSTKDIIDEDRARVVFGNMAGLMEEITQHGQLYPLLVDEHNVLIDGGRRLKAFKELNIEKIICRIMPGVTRDDIKVLERVSNVSRKDFEWYEEIAIKHDLHTSWSKANPAWSYRKTAAKLNCSLGGLSSDLVLADAIKHFPKLTECSTKSKARDKYKKMQSQMEAMQAVEGLSESEQANLQAMFSGDTDVSEVIAKATPKPPKPTPAIPCAMHSDSGRGKPEYTTQDGAFKSEQPVVEHAQVVESPSAPTPALPKHVYEICSNKEFIPKIPDNTVGFIELDPPYAIDFNNTYGGIGNIETTETDWTTKELMDWMDWAMPVLYSKLLDNSWMLCWTAKEHWLWTNELARAAGFATQPPGIWAKPGGSSNSPSTNMISNYEMFLIFRKGKAVFNTPSLPSVINFTPVSAAKRQHQWEKPMEMYNFIMKVFGKPGSIFLSAFAGSGNAMVAAALNGMIPMGCDMKQKYAYQFYNNLKNHFYGGV